MTQAGTQKNGTIPWGESDEGRQTEAAA